MRTDIPVLPQTLSALTELRKNEESVDVHDLAAIVMRDPLMTVKLYAHLASRKSARQITDIETVTGCLVMMGVPPFFRTFRDLKSVTAYLGDNIAAQKGLLKVIRRATRAAGFAYDWAVRRQDFDTEVVTIAALLHDIAEMLLWCFAPKLALDIRAMLSATPGLRSTVAEREVLKIELNDLENALMVRWKLPELLVKMTDNRQNNHPQVRNVMYAVSLARHTASGWQDAALPDDYQMIADLLHLSPEQARRLVDPTFVDTEVI